MTMHLNKTISSLLAQLQNLLEELSDEQYCMPVIALSNATLGQHTRHIAEFYLELDHGYQNGIVNYDNRKRNYKIETFRIFTIHLLQEISAGMIKENKELKLIADYGTAINDEICIVETNYFRELLYNLEHTVHHMALMRIGVTAVSGIILPVDFGVAASTIKFRKTCAQ
ncbi:DinB family protein [Pedobacter sp. PAMC26386]|nr:DinB family protein [Pedobacter sp. PAMC26386]